MSNRFPLCSLLILSLLAPVGLFGGCDNKKTDTPKLPPPLVSVITVERRDMPLAAIFTGQTLGYLSVDVRAQVAGILTRRTYKEGDYVEKGQLLFEIDPAQVLTTLEQDKGQLNLALAQLTNTKRDLDRTLPLYQRNAVSQRDRDTAQAAYDTARAQVASAQAKVNETQIQLGYTKVIAPISGYTSRETRNEGNLITLDATGSLLTTINQTDPMYVTFAIPSAEMLLMKKLEAQGKAVGYKQGAPATLVLLEGDAYPLPGIVTFLDTKVDPQTSVVQARAQFPNPKDQLLPGQYASISLGGTSLINALTIPQNAVLQTAKGPMVYLLDAKNTVALAPVKLGNTFADIFLVEDGLKPGDVVVVEGIGKIVPGMVVKPQPVAPPKPMTTPALPAGAPAADTAPDAKSGQPATPAEQSAQTPPANN